MSQPRSNKRDRERIRREKASAKVERRALRREASDEVSVEEPTDQQAVLDELAALHARFDAEEIELDDFLEEKARIMGRLVVPDS